MNNIEFEEIRIKLPELRVWYGDKELFPSLIQIRLLLIFLSNPYWAFGSQELVNKLQLSSHGALIAQIHRLRVMLDRKYIVTALYGYAFSKESRSQERE
jgi:hypothetical protein